MAVDAAALRQVLSALKAEISDLRQQVANKPRGVLAYIDEIPGRRIFYSLVGSQLFTTAQDGLRGNPIIMTVNQDGPFIMTHYPVAMWRSTLPTNATDFGRWRPARTWPLPTQTLTTNFIDISYELVDAGSQRHLQNLAMPPLLSQPDELLCLPIPTLFAPNTTIQFIPTYQDIAFGGSTATTEGSLVVALPGYRVVNM